MRKTYEIRGRNPLRINDDDHGEHYKTLTFTVGYGYISAPLSKPKVKELIKDLEKWLEEEK
ncbi:hypothetical protein [Enterococcus gallinarum]|uniref:hypothetical protein n=1 Tax=Enterococcus gallinarum TaxID=1353 RepID=UPI00214BC86A|nr:hypothetical protein [Enterococcus gallinarum]MCR1932620.1 hypothetical protein [Enterococcus gallinarum]